MGALAQRLQANEAVVPVVVAGVLAAGLVGMAMAFQLPIGIALLIGPLYGALVLRNLQLGLALWVPLIFLEGVAALNLAGKAAGLLIAIAWLGSFDSIRESVSSTLRRHTLLFTGLVGILLWLSLSLAWSEDSSLGFEELWIWYALALLFLVVTTAATSVGALRMIIAGFVVGAVISVAIGIADGSLTSAVEGGARFEGTAGDPNFLAASLIAATVLAVALIPQTASPILRGLLFGAVFVLIIGLVTSGSRGGAVAAAATLVAALVFFKRQRAYVAAVAAVALGMATLAFVNAPETWERVTNFDNDNGRSDLWSVAWEIGGESPVAGIGLNNFEPLSADYVREAGTLEHVELIVDRPHLVHNTYLQLFAETGAIGLALFLGVAGACLVAAKRAADRFDARGDFSLGTLARAVLVATISVLAAAVFLSAATDKRMWLLLALGPALLAAANREPGSASVNSPLRGRS